MAPLRLSPWWWQRPHEGTGGDLGEGSGPRDCLGLMGSIHLAGLAPNSQGVASLTNRENWEWSSDATTDGMKGGEDGPSYQRRQNRQGGDGVGGVSTGAPPTTRGDRTETPGRTEGPIWRRGGGKWAQGGQGSNPPPHN